ncbi:MAG TPA: hypothetical protein VD905_19690 [Flavobacteriales bacterium]|nr:hypothetical protein [Flavobacteriales bacterium]
MTAIKQLLFTALALSLLVSLYFFSCSPANDPSTPSTNVPAKQIRAKQQNIAKVYQLRAQGLQAKNDSLQMQISRSQVDLKVLRKQVRELKFSLSQKLKVKTENDTGQLAPERASLKTEVASLISLTDQQDSICQQTIGQYQQLVSVKDTIIQSCMYRTFQTDSLLSESLGVQLQLEKQFNAQARQLKRRGNAVSALSAGLLVFSTSSLILLLTRH